MSNVGRWAPWYSTMTPADAAAMYGQDAGKVFALAADFLDGLAVEDWGCGFATFRSFHRGPYTGVDGTEGFCDVVDDLATRRSRTPGLLMRAVLEHNEDWPAVLRNAVASAQERLVIATFIPDPGLEPVHVGFTPELGVPDIAIPHAAIGKALRRWTVEKVTVPTATAYAEETVWLASR